MKPRRRRGPRLEPQKKRGPRTSPRPNFLTQLESAWFRRAITLDGTPAQGGKPLVPGRLVRLAVLARNGGNAQRAAAQLGMEPDRLQSWLRKNFGSCYRRNQTRQRRT